jgi:DNA-binding transcriptional LysR family regulator
MMIRLAVEGAGLALLPQAAVQTELAEGKLVIIEVETKAIDLPLIAARVRSKRNALADQALAFAKNFMRPP